MSEEKRRCPKPGEFSWNELIASDEGGQKKFYTGLFGWTAEAFGGGEKRPYTLFKKGDAMVGGMMKRPKPDGPTHWLAYVKVEDVDGVAANAKKLGGKIIVEPMDIPDVGRIAVILDPQGAGHRPIAAIVGDVNQFSRRNAKEREIGFLTDRHGG